MFSAAVSVGSRLNVWKMKPIWSRRSCVSARSLSVVISWPSIHTLPAVGRSRPARMCISVRLAGAGRPHDRRVGAALQVDVHAGERAHERVALAVVALDAARLDDGVRAGRPSSRPRTSPARRPRPARSSCRRCRSRLLPWSSPPVAARGGPRLPARPTTCCCLVSPRRPAGRNPAPSREGLRRRGPGLLTAFTWSRFRRIRRASGPSADASSGSGTKPAPGRRLGGALRRLRTRRRRRHGRRLDRQSPAAAAGTAGCGTVTAVAGPAPTGTSGAVYTIGVMTDGWAAAPPAAAYCAAAAAWAAACAAAASRRRRRQSATPMTAAPMPNTMQHEHEQRPGHGDLRDDGRPDHADGHGQHQVLLAAEPGDAPSARGTRRRRSWR